MTDQPRQSTGDLIGELQRWLVRSGARGVSRQLNGQIRTVLGGNQSRADVWETATADHTESPECAWCPICRARRRLRESGPGLASGVAAAADAVNVVMQDAMSAFETAVAAAGRQARTRPEPGSSGEVWEDAAAEPPVPPRRRSRRPTWPPRSTWCRRRRWSPRSRGPPGRRGAAGGGGPPGGGDPARRRPARRGPSSPREPSSPRGGRLRVPGRPAIPRVVAAPGPAWACGAGCLRGR